MIIPKSLIIKNSTWNIELDPTRSGGSFNGERDNIIVIGTKNKHIILENLYHEILEVIITESGYRFSCYGNGENGDYLFNFNHKEFQNIVSDFSNCMAQLLSTKKGYKV
jgi:hypothetical protein